MNALTYITEKYRQLEGLLVNRYGAQGISLGTYAQSLKERLPEQILRKILEVADLRNSLQHYLKEVEATPLDPDSIARKELFNIQRKVDYILKACSYPEVVLARIDVAFKELEEARSKITTLMDSFGIQGDTLEEKLDKVENELSVEALWKLCQFRDYFERAVNDDFADALRYSQQAQNLYDEITKDLKDKNASPKEILPQERYTTDKINDDVKLIDEIHQKLLLLLGANVKAPTFNMRTVLKRVNKIVDTTFIQTLLSEAGNNHSLSNEVIFAAGSLSPKQKIEELRAAITSSMGAQLHLKGKNLQEKLEKGKSIIPSSLLQKIDQFNKSSELAIQAGEINGEKLEDLQILCDDILSSVAVEIEPSNKSSELAIQAGKIDEKKLEDLQKLNEDILSNVTVETISSQDNSTKSHPKPTSKTASSTDLATLKKMQQEMFQHLGAQLHCAGKTLRTKIDSLKQQKGVSKSVIQKLNQFETEIDEVLTHKLIKPDAVDKLRQLAQEISPLLQSAITAIRAQNASAQKK
ncbi:MAG: hypothetical protein ACI4NP_06265 [Thermoguttaceae bacterium]